MAETMAKMQLSGNFQERIDLASKYDRLNAMNERCSKAILIKISKYLLIPKIILNQFKIYLHINKMSNNLHILILLLINLAYRRCQSVSAKK